MKIREFFEAETMVGKMVIGVIIIAGVALLFCTSAILGDSIVREYRVHYAKNEDVYYVKAVVKNGSDFNSYRTHDGREAVQMAKELNEDLIREKMVAARNSKTHSLRFQPE